jgi:drug/metabolite transporter (DMT)-like permease
MARTHAHPVPVSHLTAVLLIASTAVVWGFGFPMTRFALEEGVSVGALMSLRFLLAGIVFAIILRAKRILIVKQGLLDGLWLGLLLAVIFWSQTDGMRFTTTAKSGFITGLYVLFTPLLSVIVGQRIKLTTAIGTVIASFGLYLLVHLPGGWWSGWNRGDLETLLCAFLCAIHLILMGRFARRTDAWLLASSQVIVAGIISVILTAFLPNPFGYQTVPQMMTKTWVVVPTIYLALGSTVFAFWGQSRAQTQLGPAEAAVLFCIEPVTAALLSVFWLKEPMSRQQAFGGVLIVVAMIVSEALPYMFREITVADTRP